MARSTGSIAALAAVLGTWCLLFSSAAAISCYTVATTSISSSTVNLGQTAAVGSQYSVCLSYTVTGSLSQGSQRVDVSGTGGDGTLISGITCSSLPSNITAEAQSGWNSVWAGTGVTNNVVIGSVQCCQTSFCNTGLGVTLKQGAASLFALPVVNMMMLLAFALVSYNIAA